MLLGLLIFCGLLCVIVNLQQTMEPIRVYGNDVFDSPAYPWGYTLAKLYIAATWMTVFPYCGFILMHAGVAVPLLLRMMNQHRVIKVQIFHEDHCAGLAEFGVLNAMAMGVYLMVFLHLLALANTHSVSTYYSMVAPLFFMSGAFVLQSFLGVYHIHSAIQNERNLLVSKVSQKLQGEVDRLLSHDEPPVGLLQFRTSLEQVRTFPYPPGVNTFVNILRIAPSLVGAIHLFIA